MSNPKETMNWFAVYTKPRWEKKVAKILTTKGIENYCPLNKVQRQWSDRKKIILEPLFKGYVFVQIEESKKWDIKSIDGILNYVYWLGKPAILKEKEIETIKKFLNEFDNIEVVENKLEKNNKVEIKHGILMDYKGVVLEIKGNKALVRIDSMGISLKAIIEQKHLELIQH